MDIGQRHFEKGKALYRMKRYKEAIDELLNSLTYYPNHESTLDGIIEIYVKLGDYENALLFADKLFELNPTNSRVFYIKSFIAHRHNKYDEAETFIKEAIKLAPNRTENWGTYASICISLNRIEEALNYAEQGLSINPEDRECLVRKMLALGHLKSLKEAQEVETILLSLYPNDAYIHYSIGWMNLISKQAENAEASFRQSLSINPSYINSEKGLAKVTDLKTELKEQKNKDIVVGCLILSVLFLSVLWLIKWMFF
ncbi:MAG: tetratricopeptide repeat protein [Saprospiraceae bacterium]|nr:tetratricopeptide repeat protein [Saprospiraceae bacterium]